MGKHGWAGQPPASDDEAKQRILDAAVHCIDRHGVAKTTLSDVASELGVTRQTIYRHVGSMSEILSAVAVQGAADFVDRLVAHLEGTPGPAVAVVDGFLFCLEMVPKDPRLNLLLEFGDAETFGRTATSPAILEFGAHMLRRYPVDWAQAGVTEDDLAGLAEIIMRLLISMLQNPSQPERPQAEVRALLERWLVPALAH